MDLYKLPKKFLPSHKDSQPIHATVMTLDPRKLILTHRDRPILDIFPLSGSRRRFLKNSSLFLGGLALSHLAIACSPQSTTETPVPETTTASTPPPSGEPKIRIGYQKSAANLNLLKNQGQLEERLKTQNATSEWNEFTAGPQMLEALNVGSIDIAYTGETPPVFAQAAGAPLLYLAFEPTGPKAEAILVPQDSPLKTVADLKGKKVVLNKGSNVHYLLVKALEEAGLSYGDVDIAYLPPGDARPAFEQKQVDAWVIWDPFQAGAEVSLKARILRDGQGLVENRGFYLSTQSFAESQPELLKIFLAEIKAINVWASQNLASVVDFLSAEMGLPPEIIELAEKRRGYGLEPITDQVIAYQQDVADVFHDLKLIPNPLDIASVIWRG